MGPYTEHLMNPANQITGVAIYLLGHGPYRSPRPIELQFMRIDRYRGLLGSKYRPWTSVPDQLFVDINYPRAGTRVEQGAFPSFCQLLEAVQTGQVNLVFFDVEEQVGFHHHYGWISHLLKQAGAQTVNVFYDPDKVLKEIPGSTV